MTNTEIMQMAFSNAYGALDMRSAYKSASAAIAAYRANVLDTLKETGNDTEEGRIIALDHYDLKVSQIFTLEERTDPEEALKTAAQEYALALVAYHTAKATGNKQATDRAYGKMLGAHENLNYLASL